MLLDRFLSINGSNHYDGSKAALGDGKEVLVVTQRFLEIK